MSATKLSKGFDKLAPYYDFLGQLAFGSLLHQSQTFFLKNIKAEKRILLIGGGTGKLLLELMWQYPGVQVDVIDISAKMLKLSENRIQQEASKVNVSFEIADIRNWKTRHHYDLIVTPYILDCLTQSELEAACLKYTTLLEKKSSWLFVDFNIPERKSALSFPSKVIISGLYSFFERACQLKVKKLPDFKSAFGKTDLCHRQNKTWIGGLLKASVYTKK